MSRSFSGVFEFSRRILDQIFDMDEDAADRIVDCIESGRCPRCEHWFPKPPELPAGSRITKCRSVPICGRCGSDEVYEQLESADSDDPGCSHPESWPVPDREMDNRIAYFQRLATPATLTVHAGGLKMLTDDGVADLQMGPSTGGWAEFGYQDGTFEGGGAS